MVLLLVFMQLTRDLFAIAKFLSTYAADSHTDSKLLSTPTDRVDMGSDRQCGYSNLLVNGNKSYERL